MGIMQKAFASLQMNKKRHDIFLTGQFLPVLVSMPYIYVSDDK